MKRVCKEVNEQGEPCRQAPLVGKELCYWHDPENAKDAAEARRMGGLNRKREQTLATVYDLEGLETVPEIQRFLEVAMLGTLALDNSVQRNRTLISGVLAALKIHEVGELAKKLQEIQFVLQERLPKPEEKRKRWGFR